MLIRSANKQLEIDMVWDELLICPMLMDGDFLSVHKHAWSMTHIYKESSFSYLSSSLQ